MAARAAILDDSFVLAHLTGMQQYGQSFIHSIDNGTLNYYAAVHEAARSEVEEDQAHFIGESRVTLPRFGVTNTHGVCGFKFSMSIGMGNG